MLSTSGACFVSAFDLRRRKTERTLFQYFSIINIKPLVRLSQGNCRFRGTRPNILELFDYKLLYREGVAAATPNYSYSYFTIAFTASSPSTATTTTP